MDNTQLTERIATAGCPPDDHIEPGVVPSPVRRPLTAEQVVAAIYAVGAEAARRGEMFPQTSDEQREDRHAVARVAEMLRWYEKNTGCARLRGWPDA